MASTESTGGSTTGDDEESSDAAQGQGGAAVDKVLLETRRNTYQNESIANSYRQVSSYIIYRRVLYKFNLGTIQILRNQDFDPF